MGVIRNSRSSVQSQVTSIETEDTEQVQNLVEDSPEESDIESHRLAAPRRARTRRPARPVFVTKPRVGRRGRHQYNEVMHLMSLVDEEDYCREVDINDFMEISQSAFSKLIDHKDDMQIVDALMNCTEEEQDNILRSICGHEDDGKTVASTNERQIDPYVAFNNIDRSLRTLFHKKHIPMGHLVNLEEEIVNFFMYHPHNVYTSSILSSFERAILHGLCQYHHLKSYSFDKGDHRMIQVNNTYNDFIVMSPTLAIFIEQNIKKKHLTV